MASISLLVSCIWKEQNQRTQYERERERDSFDFFSLFGKGEEGMQRERERKRRRSSELQRRREIVAVKRGFAENTPMRWLKYLNTDACGARRSARSEKTCYVALLWAHWPANYVRGLLQELGFNLKIKSGPLNWG